jgi:hypothetical protein
VRRVLPLAIAIVACACTSGGDDSTAQDGSPSNESGSDVHDAATDAHHDGAPSDAPADGETIAHDADAASGPTITVGPLTNVSAPGADLPFDYTDSIPIGWGYMDPMVTIIGSDVFTPMFYPTDLSTLKKLYNLQLMKNGAAFGPALSMAYSFIPAGYSTQGAYQPPMLFASGSRIVALYWVEIASSAPASILQMVTIDTASASPAWSLVSTAWAPVGHVFNYLGAAMGSDGRIYVAGSDSSASGDSLDLLAYDTAGSGTLQTIESSSGAGLNPVYSHVVVDAAGQVYVLMTLGSSSIVCPATGSKYTLYKDVVLYVGASGTFSTRFSNASADVIASPPMGDPCQPNDSRFPLDLFFDATTGHVYSVVRFQDVVSAATPVSTDYTQKMVVFDESGAIVSSDLAPAFAPVIPSGRFLDAVSMTKVGGRFVLFGSSRDEPSQKNIAIVTTTDFKSFTPPVSVATTYGPGNSVKIFQPNKNGSTEIPSVVPFWFCGNLLNPEALNRFLDFSFGMATLK